MKKYLSILIIFIFTFTPLAITKAEDTNSAPVTFFESMDNLQKLKGYKMNQNFSGDFKINLNQAEDIQEVAGNYRFDLNTSFYNENPYENDFDSTFKGQIKLSATGKNKPFGDLSVNFRGQMISLFGDGMYLKLISATLMAKDVPAEDMQSYQDFMKEFNAQINSVRGQWIYFPSAYYTDELKAEAPEGVGELLDTKALTDKFKKDGVKKTYEGLIQETLSTLQADETMTEEDKQSITKISDEFFKTKFFSVKTLTSGTNKGLTSFYLIKPKIVKFVSKIAGILGENLTDSDIKQMASYLDRFNLSGLYGIDETNRIMDIFRLKFVLRNVDALDFLQFNYSYKVGGINEVKSINKPTDFTPVEEMDLPFLPQPMTDEELSIPESDSGTLDTTTGN